MPWSFLALLRCIIGLSCVKSEKTRFIQTAHNVPPPHLQASFAGRSGALGNIWWKKARQKIAPGVPAPRESTYVWPSSSSRTHVQSR